MGKQKKRSFDQMKQTSVDGYIFSASELDSLQKSSHEHPRFNDFPSNEDLNTVTKMAALKAAPSVVSLVSFSGDEVVFHTSGTIIEVDGNTNTVITSLHLLRKRINSMFVENTLMDNPKIVVQTSNESSYMGEIETYDFHYNLLIVKFESKNSLHPASLRMMDDDFSLDRSFGLRPHALKVNNGDPIIVVGRYFYGSNEVMAAPGNFRMRCCDRSDYGCRELLSSECNITRCGDGAPFINLSGEVIAIAFYELGPLIPFLPINIAYKWWNHYKIHKKHRHPSYGFEARNLYTTPVSTMETVLKRFPSVTNGVRVGSVLGGSSADTAGLRKGDVIIKCDGKAVKGFLELWGLMWDKVGDVVKLKVAQVDNSKFETISMVVGEAIPEKLNKWPRYDFR